MYRLADGFCVLWRRYACRAAETQAARVSLRRGGRMPCGFSTRAVQARDVMDILCINLREVSGSFGSHAPLPIRGVNLRAGYEGHAALRIRAAAVAGTITRVRVMPGRGAGACDFAALAALIRGCAEARRRGLHQVLQR